MEVLVSLRGQEKEIMYIQTRKEVKFSFVTEDMINCAEYATEY